jgi:predicted O-methyltransferase YrrM
MFGLPEKLRGFLQPKSLTRAQLLAQDDLERCKRLTGRHFSLGSRPVIRWIKGNGLDDVVTRTAIAQATRLFGSLVDYCLCTHDIEPKRARSIMAWSSQPVEWWPLSPDDNPQLAGALTTAGCAPENFGYWWKWFPERVRLGGPEWILDGDMVIVGRPDWFDAWTSGIDRVRVAQDDKEGPYIYGAYANKVDPRLALYSGLISLPARVRYMDHMSSILAEQPLNQGHDGRRDMCEQGVVAACFQRLNPVPIPLNEFPFGRAFQEQLDFGLSGDVGRVWGYHFGNAFRRENPHFERLTREGILMNLGACDVVQEANWLGGIGQWGVPGWSTGASNAALLLEHALAQPHREILELGTSRGHMTYMLANSGFQVLTVDRVDRGAKQNLAGLNVDVVIDEAVNFLRRENRTHSVIIVDVHGNSVSDWRNYRQPLMDRLRPGGTIIINNAVLYRIPEWSEETGVQWFLSELPRDWTYIVDDAVLPGIAVVQKPTGRNRL